MNKQKIHVGAIATGCSGLVAIKEHLSEEHSVSCFEGNGPARGDFYCKKQYQKPIPYDSSMLTLSNYILAHCRFPPSLSDTCSTEAFPFQLSLHSWALWGWQENGPLKSF